MLLEYPRPSFRRKDWLNLNGEWGFVFDDERKGEKERWYFEFPKEYLSIEVPYTYETKLSKINDETFHPVVWYEKFIHLNADNDRVLLNFEGVDYSTKVWINGEFAGSHIGGYAAFTFEITDYIKNGDNKITVRVEDSKSLVQPRGKQRWKNESFGCWYVQTTGIWKPVWIEKVPSNYLEKVKITPDIDEGKVFFHGKIKRKNDCSPVTLSCEIKLFDRIIQNMKVTVQNEYVEFTANLKNDDDPWSIALWSPTNPTLYEVSFALTDKYGNVDSVETYFGMRKISIQGDKILLNNVPLYQRLILDQGYWEESHLTPPNDDAIIRDIDLILAAGYNGVRKHQKIEDRRFLYWCDKKGLLVWSEMAAGYTFNDEAIHNFTREWMEIVEQFYNHPSIITWTIFNESWGLEQIYTDKKQQNFTKSMYYLTKSYDSMRPVIVNDGWEHTVSDIITLHDYEEIGSVLYSRYENKEKILQNEIPFNRDKYAFANGYGYNGQPIIISEYGGIAFSCEAGWGYGNQVNNEEDFFERFRNITTAIKKLDYVVGYCYTQITDVQQEVNGLYNIRREPKVDIAIVKRINEELI